MGRSISLEEFHGKQIGNRLVFTRARFEMYKQDLKATLKKELIQEIIETLNKKIN